MSKQLKNNERAVLITTSYKGIFFGFATDTSGETIKLRAARLCVYFVADLHGFMGLAAFGPRKGCRIGPPADIELRGITSVTEVSSEVAAKFELGMWE